MPFQTIFVGFSGGLDSTVLLHYLAQDPAFTGRISAIHVHHGISQYADSWLSHCERFCKHIAVPIFVSKVHLEKRANLEARAREARFEAFSSYLSEHDCLLLAHHSNDQAETLLLHLFRGTGIDGLAGMPETRALGKGILHRPFLNLTRAQLEAYANAHQLNWIEDESNRDEAFSRNYLRHQVIPLLQENWPSVVANLAQSARHCQDAKENLAVLALIDCDKLRSAVLPLTALRLLENIRLVNVLRTWLKYNQVRMPSANQMNQLINEVIFARADAMPLVSFNEVVIRRFQNALYLSKNKTVTAVPFISKTIEFSENAESYELCDRRCEDSLGKTAVKIKNNGNIKPDAMTWHSFPNEFISERVKLSASCATKGIKIYPNSNIEVRFRLGGESFRWHGQTKSLKKLWQYWGISPWRRDCIPLLFIDDKLASVVGFAISDDYYAMDGESVYQITIVSYAPDL